VYQIVVMDMLVLNILLRDSEYGGCGGWIA
jgi:hypothetical protein